MDYHMGLLDDTNAYNLKWIKIGVWGNLPPLVQLDLDITLLTPGFAHQYWAGRLGRSAGFIKRYRETISPALQAEAIANWNSITNLDARKLANLTPKGSWVPIVCGIHMVSDIRNGMTRVQAAAEYGVTLQTVDIRLRNPFGSPTRLPDWFRQTIPAI